MLPSDLAETLRGDLEAYERLCMAVQFPAMSVSVKHGVFAAAQYSVLHFDVLWWTADGTAIGFHHLHHHLLG